MTGSSQRLHPFSIVFLIFGSLKGFLLPGGVLVFSARNSPWEVWAMWLAIPTALYGLFRYFTTRYAFADDELVIRTGLLFRNERHIRYSRIQNIETVQNLLHRALRVFDVRVETGGGAEQEARLQVLSLDAVEEMRRHVFEGKQRSARDPALADAPVESDAAAAQPEGARVLVRLELRDLIVFGLVQNRGGLVVAAILGVLWEADFLDFDWMGSSSIRSLVQYVVDSGALQNWDLAVIAALAGIFVTFLVVVRILSVGWAIVRLYGFTLTLAGDELRTSCGLFTKVRAVIPLRRIQLISMRQAPLQRAFDRVELRVQTAGGDQGASVSREWLAPMLRRAEVDSLLADVIPGPGFEAMEWQGVDPRAWWRELRTSLRIIAVLVLVGMWFVPQTLLITVAVLLAILAYFAARGRARIFAFALADDRVAFRSGWWWRSTCLARYAKVQAIKLGEDPFDRRWKMASVSADTAGGGSHRITIPYLPVAQARSVFDHLGARVIETAFRW